MSKSLKTQRERILEITTLAMFTGIIIAMIFVPYLGFITLFGIPSITLIHIPVLIGGAMLGRKAGVFLGLVFGIGSFLRALTSVGFDYLFIFPWVSILPRVVFGLLIFDVCRLFQKWIKLRVAALSVAFLVLTVIHTLMVLPLLVATFPMALGNASIADIVGGDTMAFLADNTGFSGLMFFLKSVFLSNGAVEALLAATVGAVVADRLIAFKKSNDSNELKTGGEPHAGTD